MDNEKALKNMINAKVVAKMANELIKHYPSFDGKLFIKDCAALKNLELKQRVLLVTKCLADQLPTSYAKSIEILNLVMRSGELKGFELWPFSEYISQYGLDDFDRSLNSMYLLTQYFTAEFAVRPFLIKDHKAVLKILSKWAIDSNFHVRRWVSEGTRPLLPWGMKVQLFARDPSYTLPLLDKLKFDSELYVRKSVANHLNDLAKTHPEIIVTTLKSWQKNCPIEHRINLMWIIRHSLRTLIKKGYPAALELMGASLDLKVKFKNFMISQKKMKISDVLKMQFEIESVAEKSQQLIIDYLIYYVKSNGKLAPKVYKLKSLKLEPKEKVIISKNHSLKPITTMKYFAGEHRLAIKINGKIYQELLWEFSL